MTGKMKRFLWLTTMFVIVSCSSDDRHEFLYQSFGVVKEDASVGGRRYVRSDNGRAIVPVSPHYLSKIDKDSRVWMLFSTDANTNADTIKADVYDFLRITNMEFKRQPDDSKSDVVYLKKLWIAQDYLTLTMEVAAGSENSLKDHKYTMYSDLAVVNDTVRMEFKYDRVNDALHASFTKAVTLKLDDKINPNQDSTSVILAIKYASDRDAVKEEYVRYRR
jgi:hypothetical protein